MVVEGQDMNLHWIAGSAITMSVIASPVQRFDDRNMIFHVFYSLDDKKNQILEAFKKLENNIKNINNKKEMIGSFTSRSSWHL